MSCLVCILSTQNLHTLQVIVVTVNHKVIDILTSSCVKMTSAITFTKWSGITLSCIKKCSYWKYGNGCTDISKEEINLFITNLISHGHLMHKRWDYIKERWKLMNSSKTGLFRSFNMEHIKRLMMTYRELVPDKLSIHILKTNSPIHVSSLVH